MSISDEETKLPETDDNEGKEGQCGKEEIHLFTSFACNPLEASLRISMSFQTVSGHHYAPMLQNVSTHTTHFRDAHYQLNEIIMFVVTDAFFTVTKYFDILE